MRKILIFIFVLIGVLTSCKDSEETPLPGRETLIVSIDDLKDANGESVLMSSDIDTANHTVTLIPKEGIDKTKLRLFATLPKGALSNPILGELTDFTNPVVYTVLSASRGTSTDWTVTIKTKNVEALLESIQDVVDEKGMSVLVSREINAGNKTAAIVVSERADTTKLKLMASISEGASVMPALDVVTDFTKPVEYIIISEDGKTVNKWVVTIHTEKFIDHDSGFDYEPDVKTWTLDNDKSDDFDTRNANKWTAFGDITSGAFAYSTDNVLVKDGKLRLMANVDGTDYTAGRVKSTFTIGENTYIKIRAKVADVQAMLTSVVRLQNGDGKEFPINLMETVVGKEDKFLSSLRKTGNVLIDSQESTGTNLNNDYHVYALERRNGYLKFLFDNQPVWEFDTSEYPTLSSQALNLVIGIEGVEGVEPDDYNLPAYFLLDYVKVYRTTSVGELVEGANAYLKNPSFEGGLGEYPGDKPEGWTIVKNGDGGLWVYVDDDGFPPQNHKRLHIGNTNKETYCGYTISQKVWNLPKGLYRFEAGAYRVTGYTQFEALEFFVKDADGREKTVAVATNLVGPERWEDNENPWKASVIRNIYIADGSCEVGVRARANGKARAFIDGFKLVKVDYQSK